MSFINILFSITGIILFIVNFKQIKPLISRISEVIGYFLIVALANIALYLIFVDSDFEFSQLLSVLIGSIKLFVMFSVGLYYLNEMELISTPIIFGENSKGAKINNDMFYIKKGILTSFILLAATILLLQFTNSELITFDRFNLFNLFFFLINSFLQAFTEETVVRLFMLALFTYLFKRYKFGYIVAILISTLIWTFDHPDINTYGIIRIIQLSIIGIVLGFQMRKYGWEACVVSHMLFNFYAFLFLGAF